MSIVSLFAESSAATMANVPAAETSPLISMAQVLLPMMLIIYFFMIRPNQKKLKEFNDMTQALRRGDKVVTGGGIIGTIHKLEGDDILVLEIAPDVKVRVMRDSISHVVSKTVANDNKADTKSEDTKTNAN
jgi:preprotein translocase subunit YajC